MTNDTHESDRRRRHRNERIAAAIVVAIALATTIGVIVWQRRVTHELRSNTTYIPKKEKITPEVLLLSELVRIDTSTPDGAAKGARWIAAYLAKNGIRAEIIESAPGRLNVYARLPGRQAGDGLLLFNHIDVVPPGSDWNVPPFEARIAFNQMWGRGTLDMKAMTICQLLALVDVARSGRPPEHDLAFLATADEETGSEYGMRWILANRPDVLEGIRYGITEGGVTEMQTERMTYFGIEVGGKQEVELTLEGNDVETLRKARIALEPFMFAREPERVLPVVRAYFQAISPTRTSYRADLADIDKAIRAGRFWRLPMAYRDLTQNTLWISAPQRSEKSGRWSMTVRLVNLPDEIPENRVQWLMSRVAPYGLRIGEIKQKQGPVPVSSHDTVLFSLIAGEAKRRYGVTAGLQLLYRSATDSRFLRPAGIICYGVSPYPVTFYQSLSIHRGNERIQLDGFVEGTAFLRNVVRQWSASTP